LAFFADPRKKVQKEFIDLEPIKNFFQSSQSELILGDDPRKLGRLKPFSVAPISIGSDLDGYLYIILGGEQYDTAAGMVRESFIIKTTIIGVIISVIITAFVGLLLFFFLTRRLKAMMTMVRRFEDGELEQRVMVHSRDEIGQLGNSFNHMADTIEANMEELKHTDDLRRELIANVSHDLRSPIASIRGYLETIIMKEDQISVEERSKYLNMILSSSVMLSHLVEELFELSKLDARQIKVKPETFSMAELVQDVVLKYKPQAEKSGVQLDVTEPPHPYVVYADIGLIERALSNLIENAIKYTPEKGAVKVVLDESGNSIITTVTDTGTGISPDDLPHVFDRYYRGHKDAMRDPEGTGLGLAIAKKILELHESDIQVESQTDLGTKFYFALQKN
jgi:signal transduction histidine kinase